MRPDVRFHSIVVTLTVAAMFLLVTQFASQIPATSSSLGLLVAASAASSLGFYRALAIVLSWVLARWTWGMKMVLGPYFVRGTWIGLLWTKTKHPRVVVEHYDQSLETLSIRGQSFKPDGELNATWYTHSAQIQAERGLLHCFYGVNVLRKHYEVEGIGVLMFDRPGNSSGPRAMSGYGLDTDAGLELERWKTEATEKGEDLDELDYSGKLIFEEYWKLDDRLIPIEEAKEKAIERYKDRAAVAKPFARQSG